MIKEVAALKFCPVGLKAGLGPDSGVDPQWVWSAIVDGLGFSSILEAYAKWVCSLKFRGPSSNPRVAGLIRNGFGRPKIVLAFLAEAHSKDCAGCQRERRWMRRQVRPGFVFLVFLLIPKNLFGSFGNTR